MCKGWRVDPVTACHCLTDDQEKTVVTGPVFGCPSSVPLMFFPMHSVPLWWILAGRFAAAHKNGEVVGPAGGETGLPRCLAEVQKLPKSSIETTGMQKNTEPAKTSPPA